LEILKLRQLDSVGSRHTPSAVQTTADDMPENEKGEFPKFETWYFLNMTF
jgi:hypothetical protein